jgi:hypothetical protein
MKTAAVPGRQQEPRRAHLTRYETAWYNLHARVPRNLVVKCEQLGLAVKADALIAAFIECAGARYLV